MHALGQSERLPLTPHHKMLDLAAGVRQKILCCHSCDRFACVAVQACACACS